MGAEAKRVKKKSPIRSGGWEEPRGSQEQEQPDEDPETSQDEAPGQSRGREESRWRRL